jgi:hypothetical protein
MKKLSIFLAAAMLVGIGSAFTTVQPLKTTAAHGLYMGNWYTVDTDDVGLTYNCINGSDYCLFGSEDTNDPLPGESQNKQFIPAQP